MNDKEIVVRASGSAAIDSRQTKMASDVLKILADNNTTVSEANEVLKLVDKMITTARLDFARVSLKIPPGVLDVD